MFWLMEIGSLRKLMFSLRCLRAKKVLKLRTENLAMLDGV